MKDTKTYYATYYHTRFDKSRQGDEIVYSADVSELGLAPGSVPLKLFADGTKGLTIIGKEHIADFQLDAETVESKQGDWKTYKLRPTNETLQKIPKIRKVRVVLYND